LVKETGVPGENHQPAASHWQTLSHNVVHLALIEIQTTTTIWSRPRWPKQQKESDTSYTVIEVDT
jgi:hypothetical protein